MSGSAAEQRLAEVFSARKLTIATAESCTGGLIAHRITTISGSSAYFLGGVVSYSNELKQKLLGVTQETLRTAGAVSAECAIQMASGVRGLTGALVGISSTGIAGPGGATPTKPVGLVYIACSAEWGDVVREFCWTGDRLANIQDSAEAALQLVLHHIEQAPV